MRAAGFLAALCVCAALHAASQPALTLPASAGNGLLRVTLKSFRASAAYGGVSAPVGRQFAIFQSTWENRADAALAKERGLATEYEADDLAAHLYLGIDGQAGTLRADLADAEGTPVLGKLHLAKPGATRSGDLVFEIPAGSFSSVELRFFDDTTGYFAASLGGPCPPPKPVLPLQHNAAIELGVLGVEDPYRAVTAPAGCRAVAVELRGRSVYTVQGDAPSYDSAAKPGDQVKRIHLLDWPETRTYIQLLADGEYAYSPEEASTLPPSARFIPEFFSGGKLVFFVPAKTTSLALVCEMPHAELPGAGVVDFAPIVFAISEPVANDREKPTAQLSIHDDMFEVEVLSATRAATFTGEPAGDGKQFLLLHVRVSNQGKGGEFFQPREQVLVRDASDAEIAFDDLTLRGPHRPQTPLYVPAGASRRYEAVFRIDVSPKRPRLSFHGGSFQESYDLNLR